MASTDFTSGSLAALLPGSSSSDLVGLIESCATRQLTTGETLLEQGAQADHAYLIIDGQLEVSTVAEGHDQRTALDTIGPGSFVGTTALLSDGHATRNASIVATTDTTVVVIDRGSFSNLIATNTELAHRFEHDRVRHQAQHQLLRTPLYPLLTGDQPLAELTRHFEPGEPLLTEGDPADGMYLIVEGSVAIFKLLDGLEIRLGTVLAHGVVGELGILDDTPRAATARAETSTDAVFIPRARLDQVLQQGGSTDSVHAYFTTLRRLYELPDGGLVSQNVGSFEGEPAVLTTYDLPGDRQIVCHSVPNRDLHHATVVHQDGPATEGLESWNWSADGQSVTLTVDTNQIPVEVRLVGATQDFRLLYRCVVAGLPLGSETLDTLTRTGRFELDRRRLSRLDDDEICTCMGVTEVQISRVVRTFKPTVEEVQEMLGCATVCGSCIHDVEDLVQSKPEL